MPTIEYAPKLKINWTDKEAAKIAEIKNRPNQNTRPWQKKCDSRFLAMCLLLESGMNYGDIANVFNTTRENVNSIFLRREIKRTERGYRKSAVYNKRFSEMMGLLNDGNSIQEIAKKYNMAHSTVWKFLKYRGVTRKKIDGEWQVVVNGNT